MTIGNAFHLYRTVMMEGDGWRPSGWLALITAGALWVRLSDESEFEQNIRQLHGQIQKTAGATVPDELEEGADEVMATATEAKEELQRLRDDLTARADAANAPMLADPSQPATIPAGVPKLPPRFQTTEQIQELTRLVLSTAASDMAMPRVGFHGKLLLHSYLRLRIVYVCIGWSRHGWHR
eukprot:SAG31_NODE_1409_length_8471_cov_12.764931_4_plen_181_part_00